MDAPEGTHYRALSDNIVVLEPDEEGKVEFKTKLNLPEELKHIPIKNIKEMMELLYRAQKSPIIEVEGIQVNGIEITEDEYLTRFGHRDMEELEYFIFFDEFPPPFEFEVHMNDQNYKFLMKREPYANLTQSIFKSDNFKLFQLTMRVDEKTRKVNIQFHYDLTLADSIDEILSFEEMIKDYSSGKIFIKDLKKQLNKETVKESTTDLFDYYRKLKTIEEYFNIKFDIKRSILVSDVKNIEKIYSSFILKKYYTTDDFEIDEITITFNKNIAKEKFNQALEDTTYMSFRGYTTEKLNVLGTELTFKERYIYPKVTVKEPKDISDDEFEVNAKILQLENYKKIYRMLLAPSDESIDNNVFNMDTILNEAIHINLE